MTRRIVLFTLSLALAGVLALPARAQLAQPAPRRVSFADVATAVVQSNLQLRGAALDVAIAQAQLRRRAVGCRR